MAVSALCQRVDYLNEIFVSFLLPNVCVGQYVLKVILLLILRQEGYEYKRKSNHGDVSVMRYVRLRLQFQLPARQFHPKHNDVIQHRSHRKKPHSKYHYHLALIHKKACLHSVFRGNCLNYVQRDQERKNGVVFVPMPFFRLLGTSP